MFLWPFFLKCDAVFIYYNEDNYNINIDTDPMPPQFNFNEYEK